MTRFKMKQIVYLIGMLLLLTACGGDSKNNPPQENNETNLTNSETATHENSSTQEESDENVSTQTETTETNTTIETNTTSIIESNTTTTQGIVTLPTTTNTRPVTTTPIVVTPPVLKEGRVIDTLVIGLHYKCGNREGVTDAEGKFYCYDFPVLFSMENLIIGSRATPTADGDVYIQDIVGVARDNFTDKKVIRIAKLLQTSDNDGNLDNNISISSGSITLGEQTNLDDLNDTQFEVLLTDNGLAILGDEEVVLHLIKNASKEINQSVEKTKYELFLDAKELTLGDANVTSDLSFPTQGNRGSSISYVSEKNEVLSSTGIVHPKSYTEGNTSVTIVATFSKDDLNTTVSFVFNVVALPINDLESITLAKEALSLEGTLSALDTNLNLPTTGLEGVSIVWNSENLAIANDGTVTRPSFSTGNSVGDLVATLSKGSESTTKTFSITVLKLPISASESVANVKANLALEGIDALRENLVLPTLIDGVAIEWSISDESVMGTDGVIYPNNYQGADKTATLTATLTKDGVSDTKTFDIVVLKALQTDEEKVDEVLASLSNVVPVNNEDGDGFLATLPLVTTSTLVDSIVWESNNTTYVSNAGVINNVPLSVGFVDVNMSVTVTKGSIAKSESYTIRVLPNPSDQELVEYELSKFELTYDKNYTNITAETDFKMYSYSNDGCSGDPIMDVSYSSSNTALFIPVPDDQPTINFPSYTNGDTNVTVTVTVTYNGVSASRDIELTLKALPITNSEEVALAKEALTLGDTTAITEDLSLPTSINGVTIVWSSSDETVINKSGKIFPSTFDGVDKTATLTATLTLGNVTTTKNFTIKVLKLLLTDAQSVANDKVALTLGDISVVTSNLTLPLSGIQGSAISWNSSDVSVVSNTGVVTRPSWGGDRTKYITLIATITKGAISETKEFIARVYSLDPTDAELVALSKRDLNIPLSFQAINDDVTFPYDSHDNGVALSWESNNTNVLSNTGIVTRPTFLEGDTKVLLTVTFTSNYYLGASDTKSFEVTVIALPITDSEAVQLAKADLTLGDTSSVTENLTLPTSGLNETTITYSSNNTNILSNTGVVTRPAFGDGDATVILTATIVKNGVSDTKSFTIVVKEAELNLPGV